MVSPPEATAIFSNKEAVKTEVKASLAQKATLSCEVSDPKTAVKWYKDGKLLSSTKAVRAESRGRIRELVIEKMDKKDAGEYTCEAGVEKLSFKLQMTGEGVFSHDSFWDEAQSTDKHSPFLDAAVKFRKKSVNETCVVQAGESVVLTAELTAENGSVKWLRDGLEVKESRKYEIRKEGFSRSLVVKATEAKDSGSYSCQTSDDKLEFKVQVKGMFYTDLAHNTEVVCKCLHESHLVLFSFQSQL